MASYIYNYIFSPNKRAPSTNSDGVDGTPSPSTNSVTTNTSVLFEDGVNDDGTLAPPVTLDGVHDDTPSTNLVTSPSNTTALIDGVDELAVDGVDEFEFAVDGVDDGTLAPPVTLDGTPPPSTNSNPSVDGVGCDGTDANGSSNTTQRSRSSSTLAPPATLDDRVEDSTLAPPATLDDRVDDSTLAPPVSLFDEPLVPPASLLDEPSPITTVGASGASVPPTPAAGGTAVGASVPPTPAGGTTAEPSTTSSPALVEAAAASTVGVGPGPTPVVEANTVTTTAASVGMTPAQRQTVFESLTVSRRERDNMVRTVVREHQTLQSQMESEREIANQNAAAEQTRAAAEQTRQNNNATMLRMMEDRFLFLRGQAQEQDNENRALANLFPEELGGLVSTAGILSPQRNLALFGDSPATNPVSAPAVPTPAVPTPAVPTPAVPTPAVPTPAVPSPQTYFGRNAAVALSGNASASRNASDSASLRDSTRARLPDSTPNNVSTASIPPELEVPVTPPALDVRMPVQVCVKAEGVQVHIRNILSPFYDNIMEAIDIKKAIKEFGSEDDFVGPPGALSMWRNQRNNLGYRLVGLDHDFQKGSYVVVKHLKQLDLTSISLHDAIFIYERLVLFDDKSGSDCNKFLRGDNGGLPCKWLLSLLRAMGGFLSPVPANRKKLQCLIDLNAAHSHAKESHPELFG